LNFIFGVLEISTNMTATRKGWQLYWGSDWQA